LLAERPGPTLVVCRDYEDQLEEQFLQFVSLAPGFRLQPQKGHHRHHKREAWFCGNFWQDQRVVLSSHELCEIDRSIAQPWIYRARVCIRDPVYHAPSPIVPALRHCLFAKKLKVPDGRATPLHQSYGPLLRQMSPSLRRAGPTGCSRALDLDTL